MRKLRGKTLSRSLSFRSVSSSSTTQIAGIHENLVSDLNKHANPTKKAQIEKYMKYTTEYRGLGAIQTKMVFKSVWENISKKLAHPSESSELAEILLRSQYGEDKTVGMMIYGKICKNIKAEYINGKIKSFFLEKHIQDWAMCDSICSKLLKPWTLLSCENSKVISEWSQESNCWLKRASCVTFVTRARFGDENPNYQGFLELLFKICNEVVQCNERFAQLGCGWLLREMSLADLGKTKEFIEKNFKKFSREGLRYAVEKMNEKDAKGLLEKHKKIDNFCLY